MIGIRPRALHELRRMYRLETMSTQADPKIGPESKTGSEPTIGKMVADVSRDISDLIQAEIQLAKTELKVSVKAGGIGAALLAVAGFLAIMMLILLSFAVAYFITMTGLHAAWAFLIVTGFYLLLALIAALLGIRSLKKIRAPRNTIDTASESPGALKSGGTGGGPHGDTGGGNSGATGAGPR